jgi:transcriptional regulator with XRE-family HTH domain
MSDSKWHAGRAIEIARRIDEMTQEELCEKMAAQTGEHWSQSKLSRIEKGRQEPAWTEVLAFSAVQGRRLEWYSEGPVDWLIPGSRNGSIDYVGLASHNRNLDWAQAAIARVLFDKPPPDISVPEQPELPISFGPRQSSWFSMARERLESAAA